MPFHDALMWSTISWESKLQKVCLIIFPQPLRIGKTVGSVKGGNLEQQDLMGYLPLKLLFSDPAKGRCVLPECLN